MSESVSTLGPSLGSLEFGVIVSSLLYGMLIVQASTYYQAASQYDSVFLKSFLPSLLETLHSVFNWIYLYSATVTNIGDLEASMEIPWSMSATVPLTSLVSACVQGFFAYRIYMLSQSCTFRVPDFIAEFKWLAAIALVVGAVIDVSNTAAMCYWLVPKRVFCRGKTLQVVDKLVWWTIGEFLIHAIMRKLVKNSYSDRNWNDNQVLYWKSFW
ncbi:hypothetical protein K435DRAFT_796428 [Dendrothele bispora CBS 962.96]|uniref:Uncharacterized protein n=1 Tax=Dendrothele bispora (strain CBS 962.96) TaxID=1314807 RepID=A0A4S8M5Q5_DENBC|nr:hypothetical protein K435DRAFT_796428 [Dendrothele bispora CBS 962.96]